MSTALASDAAQRTLGSSGTQARSRQAAQGFPAAWAQGGDKALAWGAGLGSSCVS